MKIFIRAVTLLTVLCVLLPVFASCSPEDSDTPTDLVLYVSAGAAADGNGTEDAPFRTIHDAYLAARAAQADGRAEHVTVSVGEGEYFFSEELILDGAENISFVGSGENVIVTGEKPLSGADFTSLGDGVYTYTFPDSAKDAEGNYPAFRELALDGERLSAPRSATGITKVDSALFAKNYDLSTSDGFLYLNPSSLAALPVDAEGYFLKYEGGPREPQELHVLAEWKHFVFRMDRIPTDGEGNRIFLPNLPKYLDNGELPMAVHVLDDDWYTFLNCSYESIGEFVGCEYWFSGNRALLSENGEFVYDRATGTILVKTDKDLASATFCYATQERFFVMKNVKNITVEGMDFLGTAFLHTSTYGYFSGQAGKVTDSAYGFASRFLPVAAIYGENAESVTVRDCTFTRLAYDAVFFEGAVDLLTVASNRFTDIGGTAVRVGEGSDLHTERIHNRDIVIHNNYMKNIASQYYLCPAICVSSVQNLEITHNTVIDTSYSAVSVGYNWLSHKGYDDAYLYSSDFVRIRNADISYNYFQDFMTRLSDGGAIYVVGGNGAWNDKTDYNRITHNYAVESSAVGGHRHDCVMPYYHDGGSSHWYDENNVLVLAPDARQPLSYLFYQPAVGGPSFNNEAHSIYIVGYKDDTVESDPQLDRFREHLKKNPFIGWAVMDRRLNGLTGNLNSRAKEYRVEVDPETGAYTLIDKVNAGNQDTLEDIYLYGAFGDATYEATLEMLRIYESCGSSLLPLPLAFGETPE